MFYYGKLENHKLVIQNQEDAKAEGLPLVECELGPEGTIWEKGYAPEVVITREEVEQQRIAYRQLHMDDFTLARMRKQANGTWTEDDEAAYLALDAQVTAYIEENFPYPEETLTEPSSSNIIETSETDINSILGE